MSSSVICALQKLRSFTFSVLDCTMYRDGPCSDDGGGSDLPQRSSTSTAAVHPSSSGRSDRGVLTCSAIDDRTHRSVTQMSLGSRRDTPPGGILTATDNGRQDWRIGNAIDATDTRIGFQTMNTTDGEPHCGNSGPVTSLSAMAAVPPWLHGLGLAAAAAAGLAACRSRGGGDITSLVDFASSLK